MTSDTYFKFRGRFELFPHRYDIGWPIFTDRIFGLNFFVDKIYKIGEDECPSFYNHQLNHYLKGNAGQEEAFFDHVYDIITTRIKFYKGLKPSGSPYAKGLILTAKLEVFLTFLKSIDQWHKTQPLESVIADKNKQIDQLEAKIKELENQIRDYVKYEAGEKIVISKDGLPVFIDLIDQIRDLKLPNDNKLVNSQTASPWYKLIAKNFLNGDKPIAIGTAQNYFPADKDNPPPKYTIIAEKDKLFKIIQKPKK
ncbi:SlyX family protein [Mucilaginibacter ginsenosidivorax]|uniref:SlyX family protein n=1 Tax=Mucilaginibacter ginsenosidivorax TaxID=862126 RepID=A0A5B8VXA9_9SPHI|nr:SlyX family protein [Mucilaginibacter ginsenosidivorax]QEC75245.1 SlyX family protein [Mucilaginibacter ginsenosidivorax]